MLAKILEDMWVEPEVLEALSEEQKRILFLKMREEQVRRWREREEREERERGVQNNSRPKKASGKQVRWLLGRDGDVSVSVFGEVEEFKSSKLLQNLMKNRLPSDNMNGIQTVDLLPGREARELGFKEKIQLPLADVIDFTMSMSSEEDMDSCSADDDLRDPAEDSDSESGSSSDNFSDCAPLYRPHFSSHGNQPPLKAPLSGARRGDPQDGEIMCYEKSVHRGRVAQLRVVFADDRQNNKTTPAFTKPPIPARPAHLQRTSTTLSH